MRQSKTRIFVILVLVLLALAITVFVDIAVTSQASGSAIIATRLSEKPDICFVIDDSDYYFLKAIANENKPVFLGLFGDTEIDELITFYNTSNVAYLDEYFAVYRFSIDAFSFGPYLLQVAIVEWALLIIYRITLKELLKFQSKFLETD